MPISTSAIDLISRLEESTSAELDALDFGVIGFDRDEMVVRYNRSEAERSGLSVDRVVGKHLFEQVAPCTNNYMIAERFRTEAELDDELDYVFTLRMKPTPVHLRLLADPATDTRYMIVTDSDSD